MKLHIWLSVVTIVLVYSSVTGQDEPTKPIKKINIQSIQIQTGFITKGNSFGTLADFKKLAPESDLLENNMDGFSQSDENSGSTNGMFSAAIGMQFGNKEKADYRANPILRLGVSYYWGENLIGDLNKEIQKPYDTLISTLTGRTYYVDSIISEMYDMRYLSEQLRFDGSLIFRSNPKARVSLYTGIGLSAGFSINTRTEINYSQSGGTETVDPYYHSSSSMYMLMDFYKTEKFKNESNFNASAYIPMGVDFRLGRKNEFWKLMHLFYEMRPGINLLSIPELDTNTSGGIQIGFGLRVSTT